MICKLSFVFFQEAVCLTCGIVASEIKLVDAPFTPATSSTFVPYSSFAARIHRKKKPPKTLVHGLEVIERLCHENDVKQHSNLKEVVINIFKHLCSIRNFRTQEDAGVTAACCLFQVFRENEQVIPIKTICRQIQCAKGKFSHCLKYVKSYEKDHPNSAFNALKKMEDEISEEHPSVSMKSLIREVCSNADPEEKNVLMEKTTSLLKLADDCWLFTGRSPRSVVVACAYLCWKSLKPSRKKASFVKFCKSFGISEPVAKLRIPELKELLLKLGKKIPHYNPNYVNEENLLFHLTTILENSETLRNDLLPDTHKRDAVNFKEYTTFRFPPDCVPRKEPKSSVIYAPDMNASDVEISDSEIESYIRSDVKKKVSELFKKNYLSVTESKSSNNLDSQDSSKL